MCGTKKGTSYSRLDETPPIREKANEGAGPRRGRTKGRGRGERKGPNKVGKL